MTMTPDAKRALSTTIRGLRARLLDDLHATTEATYRLSVLMPVRFRSGQLTQAAPARPRSQAL